MPYRLSKNQGTDGRNVTKLIYPCSQMLTDSAEKKNTLLRNSDVKSNIKY